MRNVVDVLAQPDAEGSRGGTCVRAQGAAVDGQRQLEIEALIDFGVDGIITDYPDRLREVMAEKGLALP